MTVPGVYALDQGGAGCGLPQAERKGDWMQTFTGRQYWPLDPRAEDVELEDIAHHLSMICRYCGACTLFWSVAEHSVGVLDVLEKDMTRAGLDISAPLSRKFLLAGLLHDAPEAYCHDIIRPIKRCIHGYGAVEQANMDAIALRFGLPLLSELDASRIKHADNAMALAEQGAFMAPPAIWEPTNGEVGRARFTLRQGCAVTDVPAEMLADARRYVARNRGETCTPREAKALFRSEFAALAE